MALPVITGCYKNKFYYYYQHLRIIATPGIPTMTIGTGTDSVNLDLAHITLDIRVTVTVTHA